MNIGKATAKAPFGLCVLCSARRACSQRHITKLERQVYMPTTHKRSLHTPSLASLLADSEPGRLWSVPVTSADADMPSGNQSTQMYWSEAGNKNWHMVLGQGH